jgi:hypothetical protein
MASGKRAAQRLRAGFGDRCSRGVGADEADDAVPAARSSLTTAVPMWPDAPVTNTRMRVVPFGRWLVGAARAIDGEAMLRYRVISVTDITVHLMSEGVIADGSDRRHLLA